jgi:hypothetical protein
LSILFSLVGIIAYLFGFIIFSTAKSSVHEGVALIAILNGSVFFIGAGIVSAIKSVKDMGNQNSNVDGIVKVD